MLLNADWASSATGSGAQRLPGRPHHHMTLLDVLVLFDNLKSRLDFDRAVALLVHLSFSSSSRTVVINAVDGSTPEEGGPNLATYESR